MNPSPSTISHFSGGSLGASKDTEMRRIAQALATDQESYRYLWSAAAYLSRCGEPLNDARVRAEAKRRRDLFNATMARNAAKRAAWTQEAA